MTSYQGIGVFDAIAVGKAKVFRRPAPQEKREGQSEKSIESELARLEFAEKQLIGK